MPTIELTPPLRSPKILDGSLWREVLGPELSEQLIAQAWDDVKHGRHKVSAASANKEKLFIPWEKVAPIRWHNPDIRRRLARQR